MLMQSAAFLGFHDLNLSHFMDLRHHSASAHGPSPFLLAAHHHHHHHHRLLLPTHHQLHVPHRPGPESSGSCSPQPLSAPGTPSPPPSPIRTTTSPPAVSRKPFTIDAILGLNGAGEPAQRYPQIGPFDMSAAAAAAAAAHHNRPTIPTSPGTIRRQHPGEHPGRPAKSKRIRTIFTPEQLERLEAEFDRQQYMVGPERLYLAHALRLTEAQVKVWFQNRRIKWRKQHFEQQQQRLVSVQKADEQQQKQLSPLALEESEFHSGSDEAGGSSSE